MDTDIQQTLANTNKLLAEAAKLAAEERKLAAEEHTLNIDRWVAPAVVVFGGLGSFVAAAAAVYRLLHG